MDQVAGGMLAGFFRGFATSHDESERDEIVEWR